MKQNGEYDFRAGVESKLAVKESVLFVEPEELSGSVWLVLASLHEPASRLAPNLQTSFLIPHI